MRKKRKKQPTPQKGFEFIGWATFNWGISRNSVFRTRQQAQNSCAGKFEDWNDVKDHMKVMKVKCVVI